MARRGRAKTTRESTVWKQFSEMWMSPYEIDVLHGFKRGTAKAIIIDHWKNEKERLGESRA